MHSITMTMGVGSGKQGKRLMGSMVTSKIALPENLATNIGEDVVYLVEGVTIRHPETMGR